MQIVAAFGPTISHSSSNTSRSGRGAPRVERSKWNRDQALPASRAALDDRKFGNVTQGRRTKESAGGGPVVVGCVCVCMQTGCLCVCLRAGGGAQLSSSQPPEFGGAVVHQSWEVAASTKTLNLLSTKRALDDPTRMSRRVCVLIVSWRGPGRAGRSYCALLSRWS